MARARNDERERHHALDVVGASHDRGFGHRAMDEQRGLELHRAEPVARDVDDVVAPARHPQLAVLVEQRRVRCAVAAGKRAQVGLGVAPTTAEAHAEPASVWPYGLLTKTWLPPRTSAVQCQVSGSSGSPTSEINWSVERFAARTRSSPARRIMRSAVGAVKIFVTPSRASPPTHAKIGNVNQPTSAVHQ